MNVHPQIPDGYYIIADEDGDRYVVEKIGNEFYPTGGDYDPWQHGRHKIEIKILARIDAEALTIEALP